MKEIEEEMLFFYKRVTKLFRVIIMRERVTFDSGNSLR